MDRLLVAIFALSMCRDDSVSSCNASFFCVNSFDCKEPLTPQEIKRRILMKKWDGFQLDINFKKYKTLLLLKFILLVVEKK